ncbi:glycosyltransferase family 39 protein [Pelagicoccus sp. SDUM812003]|uniref:glycosyltransferase family 39 protein n=1 Tax=Pelagicoccus sp. SDUM812003 TaxID=3041267 RepID=UPI0028103D65|nr:glycosyltransferase family 39 protein [Pelagicoccus sp. SDUM812003]MDQ8203457.1 glycosyltransferase family 39 protein [Pelagicoccus sp. SDUM812003]
MRLTSLALSSALAATIGFLLFSPDRCELLLSETGYWFTLACVGIFTFHFWQSEKPSLRLPTRRTAILAGSCLAMAGLMFLREGPSFKVTMDEPNLANVAISMHEHRDTLMREASADLESSSVSSLDKRPFLFPFLVSTIHDVVGFHPHNPFYLNLFLTALLLFTAFSLVAKTTGSNAAGAMAAAFIAFHPLFVHSSSGGGFDLLNALLIALLIHLGMRFARTPEPTSLNTLLSASALLAYTRYESALFVFAAGAIVIWRFWRSRAYFVTRYAILFPCLLLPIAWQNKYIRANPDFWNLQNPDEPTFGLDYLTQNLSAAWRFFISPAGQLASSPFASVLGFLSLLFVSYLGIRKLVESQRRHINELVPAAIVCAFTIGNFGILMLYFWGNLDDVAASRLAIPLLTVFALATGWAYHAGGNRAPMLRALVAGAIFASCIYSFPVTSQARYTKTNLPSLRFEWAQAELSGLIGKDDLVVGGPTRLWSAHKIPAIPIRRAVLGIEPLSLHLRLSTYDDIFVIQHLHHEFANGEIVPTINAGNDLGPAFKLEPIAETSTYPFNLTRLSRLVAIDLQEVEKIGLEAYHERFGKTAYQTHKVVSEEALANWEGSLP